MKKIRVRIKKPNNPVSEAINPELGAAEKWKQFIQSVDDVEWKWLKKRLGLLTQVEWLQVLNATEQAQKGNLNKPAN